MATAVDVAQASYPQDKAPMAGTSLVPAFEKPITGQRHDLLGARRQPEPSEQASGN